ncbi:conserved hypothetical protein [Leishmania major strain Friedlin]|uniref:Uncharacterized protein n=1 Tax=Leishmania major TaxID=5664 RepID=Q4Q406_LEIMA|nr:conserved hypothetical protein [Leishmania major strain Friedlin]CAG9580764.1 hypothetical_protein_-_conserved [Leishmania major strain Friedlin]CAJ06467.1 conserved hypothetical protein [Leishmania major strain Friedlin]|eukprot:XP_001685942.1 conserved hypothetical protein [Leishmania major strain Friedlin]
MTEYKKLTTLADTLAQDVSTLKACCTDGGDFDCNGSAVSGVDSRLLACDAEHLHLLSTRIREAVADGIPRLRKIVLKARETDPDRQIYNEAMCAKIEALFLVFCEALRLLAPGYFDTLTERDVSLPEDAKERNVLDALLDADFDPNVFLEESASLQAADAVHNHYILHRAKAEAWQSRVAQGLADAVAFESQNRAFILAEEKVSRVAVLEAKRTDKVRVTKIMEVQAELQWQTELQRRDAERSLLIAAAAAISDIDTIPFFLASSISDEALRVTIAGHTLQLIKALLSTPEDMNIRRLRNNNEHLLRDYGHPCLSACDPETGERCVCQRVVSAAEVLWCRIGYIIRYTKVPNSSLDVLRSEAKAHSLLLPCGRSLSAHNYEPMGFEDYSERLFELEEPDAMERADEWMKWYAMMQRMESMLSNMMPRSYR